MYNDIMTIVATCIWIAVIIFFVVTKIIIAKKDKKLEQQEQLEKEKA